MDEGNVFSGAKNSDNQTSRQSQDGSGSINLSQSAKGGSSSIASTSHSSGANSLNASANNSTQNSQTPQSGGIFTPAVVAPMVVDHDIILDGNKKPRRWLIPVLIGSLVILILIGIVAFAVSRSGRSTAGSLEAALSQYLTLVEQGPADDTEGSEDTATEDDEDDETWFLLSQQVNDLAQDDAMGYFSQVRNSYDDFASYASKTNRATEVLATYPELLTAVLDLALLDQLSDQVIRNVAVDGSEKAYNYIQTILPDESSLTMVNQIRAQLEIYFSAQLSAAEIYAQHECFIDGELDRDCSMDLDENNDEIYNTIEKATAARDALDRYSRMMKDTFIEDTEELKTVFNISEEGQNATN